MLADRIRAMGTPHWLSFFGLVLAAWAVLYATAVPPDLRAAGQVMGAEFWVALCTITPDAAGVARLTLMWMLMAAAMMAPSALPSFATYDDLSRQAGGRFAHLVAGYMAVWAGFAVLAALVQTWAFQAGLVSVFGDSRSVLLSSILLIVAGAYQFSPLKSACVRECRSPLAFFMDHWDEGPFRNGLRLGLSCVGCCWALMALALVGGMTSLAFMGLATGLMIMEKLPGVGEKLTAPLGVALIAAGLAWPMLGGI